MAGPTITWDTIYDNTNPLPLDLAKQVIKILMQTAVVAARDFADFSAQQLVDKVSYVNTDPTSVNFGVNYMKVSTGRNAGTARSNIDVVILYQYLNHRSNQATMTKGTWASSVGFRESLVPLVTTSTPGTGDPNSNTYPYAILAVSFTRRMNADLKSFSPSGKISYIYDDVDHKYGETDPTAMGVRRTTPIGELGWVAQNNNDVKNLFTFSSAVYPAPQATADLKIPDGYFRPGDTQIVITQLTALP